MNKEIKATSKRHKRKKDKSVKKERTFRKDSITYKIISKYGELKLREIWTEQNGMFGASDVLSEAEGYWVAPYIVRYICQIFNWKRTINCPDSTMVKSILNGKVNLGYYKHIEFGEKINEIFHERGII